MEKSIYTFLNIEKKDRYQLVECKQNRTTKYQIRKNRRIICTFLREEDTKKKLYIIIGGELLQTKLF